jgi:large repetitive protein
MGAKHSLSGFIKWDMILEQPKEFALPLENLSSKDLTNLRLEVVSAPAGVRVNQTPVLQLNGNSTSVLNYNVTTTEVTPGRNYEEVRMRLTSSQGTIFRFSTWVYSQALKGNMRVDPARLARSMVRDEINYVEFDIFNNGMDETGDITVMIPNLSWMTVAGSSVIPSLLPGQSAAVTILVTPGEDLQLNNPISGSIALNATNAPDVSLPFSFEPVSTHMGTLLVDVVNEYTYNTVEAPHLEGATVVVTHPYTGKLIAQGVTDINGHFKVEDIAEGYYNLRVQAPRHSSYQDIVYVEKGTVSKEVVFIGFQAITYSWEVVPTMIQDQYEITLVVEFETNVPAPVVEMIMPDTIPYLNHGETFPFILTLANHGLITAENVEITFPNDPEYEFIANVNIIDLYPKSAMQIPVMVRRKAGDKLMDKSTLRCTDFTIASYEFECGPDDQLRLARKDVYYSGRICTSPSSGGGNLPSISWFPGEGSGPGAAPGGGSIYRPFTWESSPYTQRNVGCDPCLVEFLNALWGCSPIPSTFIGGAKSSSSKSSIPKTARKAKKIVGKLLCAYKLGHSIGCKIGDITGLTKSIDKAALSDLHAAQENLEMVSKGFEAINNMAKEIYNNDDLLEKEGFGLFSDLVWEFMEEEKPINTDDLNVLLIMMAQSDVTPADINNFTEHWNVTLTAWNQGVYSPNTDFPAIIDTLLLHQYDLEHEEALQYANQRNFSSVEEMYNNAFNIVEGYTQQTSSAVCATVTVEFSQTLTMTREAFEGTLTIFNGHDSDAMQNISLDLEIRDQEGVDKTHLFQINPGDLFRITGIDGSGTLDAQTEGSAVVIFIPERGAAPNVPVSYSFGGTLSYLDPFTGEIFSQRLFPVTLQVNPSPDLHIRYFMQRDILADDPFTEEVEPSIPAELAVMIHNKGFGDAWSVNIESAQPRIIDNEKGLMIDFRIVGSNLGGKPTQLGLLNVDFGDINAGEIAVGQWWFTSTLLGHFISYEVSVNHLNSFGNPNLSLVSDVSVHELIKSVLVYGELNDSINDFLVNDIPDSEDIPDALYFSNGAVVPVYPAEHSETDGLVSLNNLVVKLTVTPHITGWNYTRLDDPGKGRFRIVSCTREDGQEIPLDNIWLTHVTIPDGGMPVYEYKMHFLDLFADGTPWEYIVVFEMIETDIPEVVAIEGLPTGISDEPVTDLQVVFNKPVNPETFDHQDLALHNQGGPDLIDSSVKVTKLDDKVFNVNFAAKTALNGYYLFTVQAAEIYDLDGNPGQTGKQVSWIQAISIPAITDFFGLPEEPGAAIDEFFVLFNMPIVEETFTSERLVLTRSGEEIASQSIVITPVEGNLPLYRISGLQSLTSQDGYYELLFKVTGIQGETGDFGMFDQPAEWSVCSGSQPLVNIENDITICAGSHVQLNALADFYNTLEWTTKGDGTFDNTGLLNPVYIPGFNDLQKGSVELCLTAFSSLCESEFTACISVTLKTALQLTCPDVMTVNVAQPPFILSGALPAGGIYTGTGVAEGSVFSPTEAGIGAHIITYTLEDELCGKVECEFVINVSDGAVSCEDVLIDGFPEQLDNLCQGESLDFGNITTKNALGLEWNISPAEAGQMKSSVFYTAEEFTGEVTITITATALIPCEDATASITFVVLPAPEVQITGNHFLCPCQTTMLTAGSGISWLWNTGETTQGISVSEPGMYSVIIDLENGCITSSEVSIALATLDVITSDVSNITPFSATAGGEFISNCQIDVTAGGLVWNTIGNPTRESNTGYTSNVSGSGKFETVMTGLSPATLYYVRAWAEHETGIVYGQQKQFTSAKAVFTLTSSTGINGTVDPAGSVEVDFDADRTFTFIPDEGYRVAEVWVDDQSQGAVDQYTFIGVKADHTIHAEFEPATAIRHTDLLNSNISIYPNPADDKFFIEFDLRVDQLKNLRYTILDFSGRYITGSPIILERTDVEIAKLLPGVYFVVIYHEDMPVRHEKIVKEN